MIGNVRRHKRGLIIGCALMLGLLGCTPNLQDQLLDTSDGQDWPAFGRTYGEQHFSPLTEINEKTINRLSLAWSVDLPPGNSVTGPIEVGGVLYTATSHSLVAAYDATNGTKLWEYDPHAREAAGRKLRQGWGSRGIAWWNGKVYTGTQDGRLIAIDAKTGKPLWSQMTVGKDDVRFISGAPRIFDGKVIIGHGGADVGSIRGYVTAFDAETGKQLWRFYTVPGQPGVDTDETTKIASKTWSGEWWKYGGGGTVWNAITYDQELDTIYLGTGNGAPWNHRIRSEGKGDNFFLCSIVALDAKTGKYKWHYQTTPAEAWDYNASMDMQVATIDIGGKPRKVLMQAPKNGFFYVIDRENGKLISAEPIAKVTWATKVDLKSGRPVEIPGARYENGKQIELWPGPNGAHNWLPMAFDPRTAITYIPVLEMPGTYDDRGIATKDWKRTPGNANDTGVNFGLDSNDPTAGTGALVAWNAATQKQVWRVKIDSFWNGGVMATAGNLVFQGHADGTFNAFDSATGRQVWKFAAGTGVIAPPITYMIKGKQYVTVLSGFGTSGALFGGKVARFGWQYRTQPRRILTFALDGKAAPLPPPAPDHPTPIEDKSFREDSVLAGKGTEIYGRRCLVCHGVDVKAAGLAPDLRASPYLQDANAFNEIVRNGALVANGMPRYEELTDEEMAAVRQYIRTAGDKFRREN